MAARSARRRRSSRGRSTPARGAARHRPWWKRWWLALLVLPALALAAVGLLVFFLVFSRVPLPEDIADHASVVFDVHGQEVGGLAAEISRADVRLAELPDHVPHAVLGIEDRDFYEHRGISTTGVARALFTNVRAGSVQQGGSTVSQQYIKNAALGAEQTYTRKVQEAALAIKLEQAYEKDQILEFYLNTVYWGRGAYGIEAAARAYYDKPAAHLDVNEAATLAALLAAPEAFDPLENPERVDGRRRVALAGMLDKGWIGQSAHDRLVEQGLPEVAERTAVDLGPNSYYLDAVRRVLGARPEFEGGELFRGLRIHTALDQELQAAAQEVLAAAVADGPTDTGAIVSVDPRTGGVRALVGGPDMATQPDNTAIVAVRQPGSAYKPFTLQAFVEAGYSPESRFPAPAALDVATGSGDDTHTVRNFGGAAFGEQTVLQATATSTNTVFVQMQDLVGREQVIEAARRAGLPRDKGEEPFRTRRGSDQRVAPIATLTLGVHEYSPLEMASAYATYAGEGLHLTPHLITRVENPDGSVIWEPEIDADQRMGIEVARTVTHALRAVVEAGSGRAADLGRAVAGKTGTTNDARDVWFVGYVPQLSTAVWLGNLDNTPIEVEEGSATGGGLAAPVWAEYMRRAVDGLEEEGFVAPDLGGLERLNEAAHACPDGYAFADPPAAADEDGFFPDILTDITDAHGRPCVEIRPEPEPECPPGFAFADPPGDDAEPRPEVLDDVTDAEGRPCVEIDPRPEAPSESEEPDGTGEPGGSEGRRGPEAPDGTEEPEEGEDAEDDEDALGDVVEDAAEELADPGA